jgi:hypothetical protein
VFCGTIIIGKEKDMAIGYLYNYKTQKWEHIDTKVDTHLELNKYMTAGGLEYEVDPLDFGRYRAKDSEWYDSEDREATGDAPAHEELMRMEVDMLFTCEARVRLARKDLDLLKRCKAEVDIDDQIIRKQNKLTDYEVELLEQKICVHELSKALKEGGLI